MLNSLCESGGRNAAQVRRAEITGCNPSPGFV